MLVQEYFLSDIVDNDGNDATDVNLMSISLNKGIWILLIIGKYWFVTMKIVLNSLYLNPMYSGSLMHLCITIPAKKI